MKEENVMKKVLIVLSVIVFLSFSLYAEEDDSENSDSQKISEEINKESNPDTKISSGLASFPWFEDTSVFEQRLHLDKKYRITMLDMQIQAHTKRKNNLWITFGAGIVTGVAGAVVMMIPFVKETDRTDLISEIVVGNLLVASGSVIAALSVITIKHENKKLNAFKKQKEILEMSFTMNGIQVSYNF